MPGIANTYTYLQSPANTKNSKKLSGPANTKDKILLFAGPDAWDLCYGAKPYSSGDENSDEVAEKPVRRRRKKRTKTKYNLRKLEHAEDRKLAAGFWKRHKIVNHHCSVRVERCEEEEEEDMSSAPPPPLRPPRPLGHNSDSDSVDDLIKSSSESEGGRASSADVLSSSDAEDAPEDHDARVLDLAREAHRAGLRKRNRAQTARAKVKASAAVIKKKKPVRKTIYCGSCKGCRVLTDCAKCTMCRDKTKFGGPGVKKQKCELRWCEHHPRLGKAVNRPEQVLDLAIKNLKISGKTEDVKPDVGDIYVNGCENSNDAAKGLSDIDLIDLLGSDTDDDPVEQEPIVHLHANNQKLVPPPAAQRDSWADGEAPVDEEESLENVDEDDYDDVMELILTDDDDTDGSEKQVAVSGPAAGGQEARRAYRPGPASSKVGLPRVVYDLSSEEEAGLVEVNSDGDSGPFVVSDGGNSYLEHRGASSGGEEEEEVEDPTVEPCIVGEVRNEHLDSSASTAPPSPPPFIISEVLGDWDDVLVEVGRRSREPESTPRSRRPEVVRLSPPREQEPEVRLLPGQVQLLDPPDQGAVLPSFSGRCRHCGQTVTNLRLHHAVMHQRPVRSLPDRLNPGAAAENRGGGVTVDQVYQVLAPGSASSGTVLQHRGLRAPVLGGRRRPPGGGGAREVWALPQEVRPPPGGGGRDEQNIDIYLDDDDDDVEALD